MPLITPAPLRARPAGSKPLSSDQPTGAVPPFTVNAGFEYAAPTSPATGGASESVGSALMMTAGVVATDAAPVPAAFVALTVNV